MRRSAPAEELRTFRTELADVTEEMHGDIYTEISSALCFADFFLTICLQTGWCAARLMNQEIKWIRPVDRYRKSFKI